VTYYATGVIESIIILANAVTDPNSLLSHLILSNPATDSTTAPQLAIVPSFVFGTVLSILSAFFRTQCYQALGRHFTFELTISPNHKLIDNGPYGLVRHPSYTAIMISVVGAYLTHTSNGSWLRESEALDTLYGRGLIGIWIVVSSAVILSLFLRIPREDALLRVKFAEEWEEWAKRVPYKLVPGIY